MRKKIYNRETIKFGVSPIIFKKNTGFRDQIVYFRIREDGPVLIHMVGLHGAYEKIDFERDLELKNNRNIIKFVKRNWYINKCGLHMIYQQSTKSYRFYQNQWGSRKGFKPSDPDNFMFELSSFEVALIKRARDKWRKIYKERKNGEAVTSE